MTGTDAEAVVDLLVCYNEHLWRPSACRTPEERHLGLITVTFLARAAPKNPKAKALLMFEQTTTSGVETSCYFVLTLTGSMSLLLMLNLLTVLGVRLLARVPTVLAVPVLELELVFERTPSLPERWRATLAPMPGSAPGNV